MESPDAWINQKMYLINVSAFNRYQLIFIHEINNFVQHQQHIKENIPYTDTTYFKIDK